MKTIAASLFFLSTLLAVQLSTAQTLRVDFVGLYNGVVSRGDLTRVVMVNTDPAPHQVQLICSVYAGSELVYEGRCSGVNAKLGSTFVNRDAYPGNDRYYGTKGEYFQHHNVLPPGHYVVQADALDASGNRLGTGNAEVDVAMQAPPQLANPTNEERIRTLTPLLQWIPPQPLDGNAVYYNMRLVEVQTQQNALSAYLQNPPLLTLAHLPALQQPYLPQYRNLQYGHTYAWKIEAYAGDQTFLGETDVWTFTPVLDSFPKPKDSVAHVVSSHWLTQAGGGDGFFQADSVLRVTYDNKYGMDSLRYTVEPIGHGKVSGTWPPVKLCGGVNYLTLSLKSVALDSGAYYVMVIRDPAGKQHRIKFYKK